MSKLIEKLATIFGSELTATIEAKLGDVELAIMNDGTVVPAAKHDALKEDLRKSNEKYAADMATVQKDLKAAQKSLEEAGKAGKDVEALQKSIEDLQAANQKLIDDHAAELTRLAKDHAFDEALTKANIKDKYKDIVKRQLDPEKLELKDGKAVNVEELVKAQVEAFPEMFGEVRVAGTGEPGNQGTPAVKDTRAQLIDKYNEAQKRGDVFSMSSLDSQIKALPKD